MWNPLSYLRRFRSRLCSCIRLVQSFECSSSSCCFGTTTIAVFKGSNGTSGGMSPFAKWAIKTSANSLWNCMAGRLASPDFPTGRPKNLTLVAIVRCIGRIGLWMIACMFVMARSKLKTCLEKITSVDVAHNRRGKKSRPVPPVFITSPDCVTMMKLQASSYHVIPTEASSVSAGHSRVSSHFKICMEYCAPHKHDLTARKSLGSVSNFQGSSTWGLSFCNCSWNVFEAYKGLLACFLLPIVLYVQLVGHIDRPDCVRGQDYHPFLHHLSALDIFVESSFWQCLQHGLQLHYLTYKRFPKTNLSKVGCHVP